MGLSGKLLQIIALPGVLIIIIFAIVAAASTTIPKPDCPSKCGDVEIPFPFGFTKGCYLDESFHITCDSGKPKTGNVTVTNISIDTHELHVLTDVAQDCYQKVNGSFYTRKSHKYNCVGVGINGTNNPNKPACVATVKVQGRRYKNKPEFRVSQYTISNSKNKFTVIGCDTIAYLSGFQNGEWYNIGCASQCPTLNNVVNGSCSGVGCCELVFPDGLKNISVEVFSFKITPVYGTSIPAAMLLLSRKASSTSPPIISKIIPTKRFHWCLIGQLAISHVKKLGTNRISHVRILIVNALISKPGRAGTVASASRVTKGTHTSKAKGVAEVIYT
jgi:hypothetical protein